MPMVLWCMNNSSQDGQRGRTGVGNVLALPFLDDGVHLLDHDFRIDTVGNSALADCFLRRTLAAATFHAVPFEDLQRFWMTTEYFQHAGLGSDLLSIHESSSRKRGPTPCYSNYFLPTIPKIDSILVYSIEHKREVVTLSRECHICGKKPLTGNTISHAHNVSKTRRLPNLQRVRAHVNGKPRRIVVCTRCIRSGKVVKSA